MTRSPSANPSPAQPPGESKKPKLPPGKALTRAKQRLLAVGETRSSAGHAAAPGSQHLASPATAVLGAARQRPMAATALALGLGAFIGYFPALRKIVGVGVAWGAKRFLGQYLASYVTRQR